MFETTVHYSAATDEMDYLQSIAFAKDRSFPVGSPDHHTIQFYCHSRHRQLEFLNSLSQRQVVGQFPGFTIYLDFQDKLQPYLRG